MFYGQHREEAGNPAYYKWLPVVSNYNAILYTDTIEVAVSDGFLWSEWTTLDMTTGVNTPATLDLINTSQLELNEWTALSSVFQINDIDGDTVQTSLRTFR